MEVLSLMMSARMMCVAGFELVTVCLGWKVCKGIELRLALPCFFFECLHDVERQQLISSSVSRCYRMNLHPRACVNSKVFHPQPHPHP